MTDINNPNGNTMRNPTHATRCVQGVNVYYTLINYVVCTSACFVSGF